MLLKTILNRVQRHKGFVYTQVRFACTEPEKLALEIEVQPRANSRGKCSGCGRRCPGYDHGEQRRFEFVPLWGIAVFLLYTMRRVQCARCGVKVEQVPWAQGKSELTTTYQWFLASWAKLLAWQQVARVFHTSWEKVYRSVQMAVTWGLEQRSLEGIESIGVDEVQWKKGHKYLTLVYQIDKGLKRLLWLGRDRTEATLNGFFQMLGQARSRALRYVCSDMWKPYLAVIRQKAGEAVHVLDRFHIMKQMNKAIDEVRAADVKQLKADGYEPVLKHARWCLLKRPENLTDKETVKLAELLKYNLPSIRSHLQREDFQRFWSYQSPTWAGKFLDEWCTRVMRSRIEPMKRVAKMLRRHRELILNWFKAKGQISSGTVEGLNLNVKLAVRKAYGFRTIEGIEVSLYHKLGALPEPKLAHKFC